MCCFLVLIFLPTRFHLHFQMEAGRGSFFFLSQNSLKEKFTELFFLMQAMELLHAGEEIFFYFEYQVENSREVIEKIYE